MRSQKLLNSVTVMGMVDADLLREMNDSEIHKL